MGRNKISTCRDSRTGEEFYRTLLYYTDRDGVKKRKEVRTLKKLGATYHYNAVDEKQAELDKLTETFKRTGGQMTLDECYELWFAVKRQETEYNTYKEYVRYYNSYVRKQIGSMPLKDITADTVRELVAEDKAERKDGEVKPPSPDQIKRTVKMLKAIFSYAVDMDYLEAEPRWKRLDSYLKQINYIIKDDGTKEKVKYYDTRDKVALTKPERKVVQKCIDEHLFETERDRIYVLLLLHYGLRKEEACALTADNFYFDADVPYLFVEHALEWRGNKPHIKGTKSWRGVRTMSLRSEDIPDLKEYIAHCDNEKLFSDGEGGFILASTLRSRWEKSISRIIRTQSIKADVPYLYHPMHEYRHTFGTILDELGMTPAQKIALMGDSTESVITNTYTHRDSLDAPTVNALNSYSFKG